MTAGPWVIPIPAPVEIMSYNKDKADSWGSSRRRADWRRTGFAKVTAARLPKLLERIRVDVEIRFPRNAARRNEVNYHPTVGKPLVDALTPERSYTHSKGPKKGMRVVEMGYGLIADDTWPPLHCADCPHITFGEPVGAKNPRYPFGLVVLTITDLSVTS